MCSLQPSSETESCICSEEKDFDKHICEMKSWFSQRGYPKKIIETEASKVKFSGQRVFHRTKVEEVFR